jgi:hypothetical protein
MSPDLRLVLAQFVTYFQYLSVAHSAYVAHLGGREGGRPSKDRGSPAFRVPGQFAVSRGGGGKQENPRLAGAGSANPGFYAESGKFHSVRERTPEVNPNHGQSL